MKNEENLDSDELIRKQQDLEKQIEDFKKERERVRNMLGKFGGKLEAKKEKLVNYVFLSIALVFFVLEFIHILPPFKNVHILPPLTGLSIGILLISVKIVWMIHSQIKVNHFEFWILNSIEFRMNEVAKKIKTLEKKIDYITEKIEK